MTFNKKLTDIIIAANSAGEIAGYVLPLAKKLRALAPDVKLTLVIVPCQYATGHEKEFAEKSGLFNQTISVQEYKTWIFRIKMPSNISFGKEGKVLFLGGDVLHAWLIAQRLRYDLFAYLEKAPSIKRSVKKFFVPDQDAYDQLMKQKIPPDKIQIVGNLMVDSIEPADKENLYQKLNFSKDRPIVSLMPGSRTFQMNYMIPFYVKTLEYLAIKHPNMQTVISLSSFSEISQIEKAAKGSANVILEKDNFYLRDKSNKTLISQDNIAAISDLAVTIPGTNTAQIALQGTPMLVIFPMDRPEAIPLEGIPHLIGLIPIIGKLFKKAIALYADKKTLYFALPNIKAKSKIVPEMRGNITPDEVAGEIERLLADKQALEAMKQNMKKAFGPGGASEKIARFLLQ